MQKLIDFYEQTLNNHSNRAVKVQKRLRWLSYSRLAAFLLTILIIYLLRSDSKAVMIAAVLGLSIFLFLVSYYETVKTNFQRLRALVKINATELKVLNHNYEDLPNGEIYVDANHPFNQDLDLFGKESFFQYLNRTTIDEGENVLANLLMANDTNAIVAKQETVDELAQKPEWRQNFMANAMLLTQENPISDVTNWLKTYTPFVPKTMRYLPWLFLAMTIFLSVMVFGLGWPVNFLMLWVVFGLGISARYFKGITQLTSKANQVKAVFKEYGKLVTIIEETSFESAQLRYHKQRLLKENAKASELIKSFSSLLNAMDYNNNFFYVIIGNGCFLGALATAFYVEKWIVNHSNVVADWFEVIAIFDAYNSLGNFSFNHPLYCYPEIRADASVFECEQMGHPLIPQKKNVRNDFKIDNKDFIIITGSNMAGKSTFLRSVGLMVVMANMGLPVCAKKCLYSPIKLVTSMRSIDSLSRGDSYFLSELKRLKMVVDLIEDEHHLIILDEILRGTNSTDKAEGSKRFLKRLSGEGATGLIATHDLSLCEVAEQLPQVHNYYLDATIKDNRLYFDYRLKKGISKTMNASFLLEKMQLV